MEQNMQDKNVKNGTIQYNKVQGEEVLDRMLGDLYTGGTSTSVC